MLDLLILAAAAVAQPTTAPTPAPAAGATAPAPTLTDIPGVTVKYYEVSGKNLEEVRQAIATQRPQGPAGTDWTVGAGVKKRAVGDKCEIVAANVKFSGTAQLPRLATPQLLKPEEIKIWNAYVAGLQATSAEDLAFVHARIGEVEKAMVSASCDTAVAAANAVVDRLKTEQRLHAQQRAAARAAQAAQAAQAQEAERQRNAKPSDKQD